MKLALDELHARKLTETKRQAQILLSQWDQAIQVIQRAEKQADCILLPNEMTLDTIVELSRQLPDANYLSVVDIRDTTVVRLNETIHRARTKLETEIQRQAIELENAEMEISAARAEHEAALVQTKAQCEVRAEISEGTRFVVRGFFAVASWLGLLVISYDAWQSNGREYDEWRQRYEEELKVAVPAWKQGDLTAYNNLNKLDKENPDNSLAILFFMLASFFVGWMPGFVLSGWLITIVKESATRSAITRESDLLTRRFNERISKLNDQAAKSAERLQDAHAALGRF